MARGFGATFGTTTTDLIQSASSVTSTQESIHCWANVHGTGGSGNGRYMCGAPSSAPLDMFVNGALTSFGVNRAYSTTTGTWHCNTANFSAGWHSFGCTYDGGNIANTPIFYLDGVAQTTFQDTAPSGSLVTGNSVHNIGNVNAQSRNMDGTIADACRWNVILTALEFVSLFRGIRPYNIRPSSILLWLPLDGVASPEPDLSGNALNGTVTGALKQFGPPFAPFTSRWPQANNALVPVAPTFQAAWALGKNVVVEGVAT